MSALRWMIEDDYRRLREKQRMAAPNSKPCDSCGAPMIEASAVFTDGDEWCWRCAPHRNEPWIDRVARGEGCA